jgi:hypothetical protein
MKEKRVDVHLTKASFWQVIFYGFGGALVAELIKYNEARPDILLGSGISTIVFALIVHHFYNKASRLSKSKRKKESL